MRSLHSHAICAVWGFSILQTCSAFCASAPYPARVGRNRGQLRMVAHVEPVLTLLLADSAPSLRYNHVWTLFAVIVRVGSTRRTRTGRRRCCIAHSVSRRFNSPTCAPAQLHTPDTLHARHRPTRTRVTGASVVCRYPGVWSVVGQMQGEAVKPFTLKIGGVCSCSFQSNKRPF